MLTKGKTSKFRAVKYLVVVVALLAVLTMCLASCTDAAVKDVRYVDGSLTKAQYNEGDIFDCTGAKITVTYDDGTTAKVDVTAAMTGEVVLRGTGVKDVAVSYTEDGVTYTAYIPVTVVNPVKDAAIAALKTDSVAAANINDKGVIRLIEAYTALIQDASATEVAALSAEYVQSVKAYVDAKAACLNVLNNTNLDALYAQYKIKAETEKQNALVLFEQATDATAFAKIASAYENAILKLIADQEFYEGSQGEGGAGENGQIVDKIDLLTKIKAYKADIVARGEDVIAYQEVANPSSVAEYKAAWGKKAVRFDWLYEYVTLAIDLSKARQMVESEYADAMKTPLDDIYAILCDVERTFVRDANGIAKDVTITTDILKDGDGITVNPAPYVKGENGAYALGTDTILKSVVEKVAAAKAKAEAEYGPAKIADMMKVYRPFDNLEQTIDLGKLVDDFNGLYNKLVDAQEDAKTVINLIATARAAAGNDAINAKNAVIAAWDALKTWNDEHKAFASMTDKGETTPYGIAYGKAWDAIYVLGKQGDTVALDYNAYDVTEETVKTYYIYNLDALFEASAMVDAAELAALIATLPEQIVHVTDAEEAQYGVVDAGDAIAAARAAYNAFITKYGADNVYLEKGTDGAFVLDVTIAEAEAAYKTLVDTAKAVREEIAAIVGKIATVDKVTIGDYKGGANLEAAYNNFIAFTKMNKANNICFNGVITNDADLLNRLAKCIELMAVEALEVQTKVTIDKALLECLDKTNADTDTAIRSELVAMSDEYRAIILAKDAYVCEYEAGNTTSEIALITAYNAWVEDIHEEAQGYADAIVDAYNDWAN